MEIHKGKEVMKGPRTGNPGKGPKDPPWKWPKPDLEPVDGP